MSATPEYVDIGRYVHTYAYIPLVGKIFLIPILWLLLRFAFCYTFNWYWSDAGSISERDSAIHRFGQYRDMYGGVSRYSEPDVYISIYICGVYVLWVFEGVKSAIWYQRHGMLQRSQQHTIKSTVSSRNPKKNYMYLVTNSKFCASDSLIKNLYAFVCLCVSLASIQNCTLFYMLHDIYENFALIL